MASSERWPTIATICTTMSEETSLSILPPIPPADPRANYLHHRAAIDEAIRRVLEGGRYILGDEVERFEAEFAKHVGVRFCVGVGSGTEALQVALRVLGVGAGDTVITVSHTAVATISAIDLCGATPLLVDVDRSTFTLDPERLEQAIADPRASRVKALIPVHLYGHPADLGSILTIARAHGLSVVEDCAQAHGASIGARRVGTWGALSAFSFYPTKNLGALGDGGAVVTDDPDMAEAARALRQYGWRTRYISERAGLNSRLDELQAAILRVKLGALDVENARRREIARHYDAALAGTTVERPTTRPGVEHVYHQYTVRTRDRDRLREHLLEGGVQSAVLYPVPVHLQAGYSERVVVARDGLAESEALCGEILSLPMYPELTDPQIEHVGDLVSRWGRRNA